MQQSWETLLANFSVVVVVIALWAQTRDPKTPRGRTYVTLWGAAVFSVGVVVAMRLPFEIRPGLFTDLRSSILVLATFFGGPAVGAVTLASALSYRVWSGGAGVLPAIISLLMVYAIGVASRAAIRHRQPSYRDVALLAAAVTLTPLFTLGFVPDAFRIEIIRILPALSTLTFVAVCVAGALAVGDLRRRTSESQNAVYRAVIEALPNALNVKDRRGRFVIANDATARLMHAEGVDSVIGRTDYDFYPRDKAEEFRSADLGTIDDGQTLHTRQQLLFGGGSEKWVLTTKAPFRDSDGAIVGVITHNQDISDQVRLESEVETTRNRLARALSGMADGLVMYDANAQIAMCNPQFAALFPKTAHLRVPGANLRDILRASVELGEEDLPYGQSVEEWIETVCSGLQVRMDQEINLKDDRWLQARIRPAPDGTSLAVMSDVTGAKRTAEALKATNAQLERLARTDGLTGLMNRRAFDEALKREFARCQRQGVPLSLFIADVDRFKAYNDAYGHIAGDKSLVTVGVCLQAALKRPADVAARYGGEEFVALLPDTDAAGAFVIAEAFRRAVSSRRIDHKGSEEGHVTVSVGVATVLVTPADSPAGLVQAADKALYAGKTGGRNRVCLSPASEASPAQSAAG